MGKNPAKLLSVAHRRETVSSENLDRYMLALRQKMAGDRSGKMDPTMRAEVDHILEESWKKLTEDERKEAEIRKRLIRALHGS
jgi:hypothetical protein